MKKTLFVHVPKTGGTTLDSIIQDHCRGSRKLVNLQPSSSHAELARLRDDDVVYVSGHIPAAAVRWETFDLKITTIRNPLEVISSILSFREDQSLTIPLIDRLLAEGEGTFPLYAQYFAGIFDLDRFLIDKKYGFTLENYLEYCHRHSMDDVISMLSRFDYLLDFSNLNSEIKRFIISEGYFPYRQLASKRKYDYVPDMESARKLLCGFDASFYDAVRARFLNEPSPDIEHKYDAYRVGFAAERGVGLAPLESRSLNLAGPIGSGWHLPETNDVGEVFRWSEKGPASIEVPVGRPGSYALHVYVSVREGDTTTASAMVADDPTPTAAVAVKSAHSIRAFRFHFALGEPGWVQAELLTTPNDPERAAQQEAMQRKDARKVGCILGKVILQRLS